MSFFSMFALYPRSGYYSGAALEVRSVALLHTFFTLLSSAGFMCDCASHAKLRAKIHKKSELCKFIVINCMNY